MSDRLSQRLDRLGQDARPPGVYRWEPTGLVATAAALVRGTGRAAWTITPAGADKVAFLDACAIGLALPPWFGRNWDALADCLADLALPPPGGVILVDANGFAAQQPDEFATTLEIFAQACVRPPGELLWVLVSGSAGTGGLPSL